MPYPQRKLHRLKEWDYANPGCYFVTICTRDRRPLLGCIPPVENGVLTVLQIEPSPIGQQVLKAWETLGQLDPAIEPVEFCMMPNHVHFILRLLPPTESERRGRRSLQEIVRGFKSTVTRQYNRMVPPDQQGRLWQSSFYGVIIRDDRMLLQAREYIRYNPLKWAEDELYIP